MIDTFRNWINMILAIGILFTVIRIIVPNTKLKKYIYSVMGIISIIVILNPVINIINKGNVEENIKDILLDMSTTETLNTNYTDISNYEEINKNNIREAFGNNLANDIKEKLVKYVENEIQVKVGITEEYDIKYIVITINGDTSFDIITYISTEYDIDKNKISVVKGG